MHKTRELFLTGLAVALVCSAQAAGDAAPHLQIIGDKDTFVILAGPDGQIQLGLGKQGFMSEAEIAQAVVQAGVPQRVPQSNRTLPAVAFDAFLPPQILAPPAPAANKPTGPLSFSLQIPTGSDSTAVTPAGTGVPANTPRANPYEDGPLPNQVKQPDGGLLSVSQTDDKRQQSPFDPARIVFSSADEFSVRVDGIVLGVKRIARIGDRNVEAGMKLADNETLVQAVRRDGIVIRLRNGQLGFIPKGREVRVVGEQR